MSNTDDAWPEGLRITGFRPMTVEECEERYWPSDKWSRPIAIELEDGSFIYPSRDPEGNGPGAFFIVDTDGSESRVVVNEE